MSVLVQLLKKEASNESETTNSAKQEMTFLEMLLKKEVNAETEQTNSVKQDITLLEMLLKKEISDQPDITNPIKQEIEVEEIDIKEEVVEENEIFDEDLSVHLQPDNNNDKQFTCTFCAKIFKTQICLRRHQLRVHLEKMVSVIAVILL